MEAPMLYDGYSNVSYQQPRPTETHDPDFKEFHCRFWYIPTGGTGISTFYCRNKAQAEKLVARWNASIPLTWSYEMEEECQDNSKQPVSLLERT